MISRRLVDQFLLSAVKDCVLSQEFFHNTKEREIQFFRSGFVFVKDTHLGMPNFQVHGVQVNFSAKVKKQAPKNYIFPERNKKRNPTMQTIFLYENLTKKFYAGNYAKKLFYNFTKNLISSQPQIIDCSKLMWIKTHTMYTK